MPGVSTLPAPDTTISTTEETVAPRPRDVVALVLMMIGLGLTISAAFLTDTRLGIAWTGLVLLTIGLIAGLDRSTTTR